MEQNVNNSNQITMILYVIDNDKKTPSQNWEIIPKKKYTIGRSKKEVDLSLNLKLLSRKHAELIYYDSKTIMVKDLESRNGTYINKLKIDPLKETFFSNKDILSFGNTNNEIVFFNHSEQPNADLPQAISDNLIENESEKDEKIDNNREINKRNEILEEINTDIVKNNKYNKKLVSVSNSEKQSESRHSQLKVIDKNKYNQKEKERNEIKKSYIREDKDERYIKNSKEHSKASINKFRSISNRSELERHSDKNKERSISNRETIDNRRNDSYNSRENRKYEEYNNDEKKIKHSRPIQNKSISTKKHNYSRSRSRPYSRSHSKETLIQEYHGSPKKEERKYPQEMPPKTKDYYLYDIEREKEREREYYNENKKQELIKIKKEKDI